MTISELQILLDLNQERKIEILKIYTENGCFFIDSDDGQCYLFNRHGNLDDVSKIKEIDKYMIPRFVNKIVIPNNVTSVEGWAFAGCSELKSVTIPTNVNNIRNYAFCNCSGLVSVTIPNNVMKIGKDTFLWCRNLKELIFKGKSFYEVISMKNYPFGIRDESIIKCN